MYKEKSPSTDVQYNGGLLYFDCVISHLLCSALSSSPRRASCLGIMPVNILNEPDSSNIRPVDE